MGKPFGMARVVYWDAMDAMLNVEAEGGGGNPDSSFAGDVIALILPLGDSFHISPKLPDLVVDEPTGFTDSRNIPVKNGTSTRLKHRPCSESDRCRSPNIHPRSDRTKSERPIRPYLPEVSEGNHTRDETVTACVTVQSEQPRTEQGQKALAMPLVAMAWIDLTH
jgi:hypothetical protein